MSIFAQSNTINMKPGRNDPCSCGSGKKYKNCCLGKAESNPSNLSVPTPDDLKQINSMFNTGRYAELENRARSLLKLYPESGAIWKLFGPSLQMQGKDALPAMQRAAELLPNDAVVQYNLGIALKSAGQLDNAAASYHRAVALKPKFAEAHLNLGVILQDLAQLQDAIASYRKALELKPDFVEAHFNLGNALKDSGQLDAALKSYHRTVELKPDFAEAHKSLGFALLLKAQFADGWKEYSWRIRPPGALNYPVKQPPENPLFNRKLDELLPSNLQGMRIVLLKDQGLGDELFFLRFARELKQRGAWLAYVADPRIASFIRRTKLVDYVAKQDEVIEDSHAAILVGDLPLVLGMADNSVIPPSISLEALPEKRQDISRRLASHRDPTRPMIGITWRGGRDQRNERLLFKEIPLQQLAFALRGIQATFVIVQRNPQPGEIAEFEAALGHSVLDLSDLNDDLEGMLALMEQLDDYISVSNTNMHLRASAGKTARVLIPHLQDFRWMAEGDSSPWFPGFTAYRRALDNSWDRALEQLKCHILPDQIR
jgi:tetratricopeptide (TPR) repeat protein